MAANVLDYSEIVGKDVVDTYVQKIGLFLTNKDKYEILSKNSRNISPGLRSMPMRKGGKG